MSERVLDASQWVPTASESWRDQLTPLIEGLREKRICVLSGAGCSTASGIPDYRGEGTARRARNPIQFRQFIADENSRRRYWARAMQGWPKFLSAAPCAAHEAIADLEKRGHVVGVITQNVDRLHHQAGSSRVVELHGALADVICLECRQMDSRSRVQERLLLSNPGWLDLAVEIAPDGDAELEADLSHFVVPACIHCGGTLKPHVVFFGEGVQKSVVDEAFALLAEADVLLVVGSSLAVFSGYRFARKAAQDGQAIYIVNIGDTRADPLATHIVPGRVGDVLQEVAQYL